MALIALCTVLNWFILDRVHLQSVFMRDIKYTKHSKIIQSIQQDKLLSKWQCRQWYIMPS